VRAIVAGEAVATFYPDPTWQGGIGLSLALAAARGELDVAGLSKDKRQWYAKTVLVGSKNAAQFLKDYYEGTPTYDFEDHFGRYLKAIP
jgi:hypothetical protein